LELEGVSLPAAGSESAVEAPHTIRGHVQNISAGGLCISSPSPIEVADPFRCEIRGSTLPIGIPTILQVRWAQPESDGYLIGLQFLL
jgi:hypothetical protein